MKKQTIELAALVATSQEGQPTVNARDLYDFIGSSRVFSKWIRERITKYQFVEGIDYVKIDLPESGRSKGRGGNRRSIEYHLSLDMAKQVAMLEDNERGLAARQYFIDCEKRLHQVRDTLDSIPMDQLINSLQRRIWDSSLQAGLLQKLLPKGEYGDPAPNGQPRNGFRRSAWVAASSRNTTAQELMKQLIMVEMLEELSHLGLGA